MFIKNTERKNWGKGIPQYQIEDLMPKDYIYDFGLDIIYRYSRQEGFDVIDASDDLNSEPSMVLEKDKQLYFVLIESDIAMKQPKINLLRKYKMIAHSRLFNAIPLYASCSFGSTDSERFEAEIALKGDSYYCNFRGFEELNPNTSDYQSIEYKLFILGYIYDAYISKNYDFLSKHIASDCNWHSEFSNASYKGKKEIEDYYKNKFIAAKEHEIIGTLCLIRRKESLYPALCLNQTTIKGASFLIEIEINNEGLISKINLEDMAMKQIRFE